MVEVRDEKVRLTYVEFEILAALALAPGRVMTRETCWARTRGTSATRNPRTIRRPHPPPARSSETDARTPEYLSTVRGVGTASATRRGEREPPRAPVGPRQPSRNERSLQAARAVLRDHDRGHRLRLPVRGAPAGLAPHGRAARAAGVERGRPADLGRDAIVGLAVRARTGDPLGRAAVRRARDRAGRARRRVRPGARLRRRRLGVRADRHPAHLPGGRDRRRHRPDHQRGRARRLRPAGSDRDPRDRRRRAELGHGAHDRPVGRRLERGADQSARS